MTSYFIEAVFPENRHTSELHISLESFFHCDRRFKFAEGQKLFEGQGKHTDFHISPGQQGGELCGEKIRIGTGDINIYIEIEAERFNGFFPMFDSLQFIKDEIGSSLFGNPCADIIVERKVVCQIAVA